MSSDYFFEDLSFYELQKNLKIRLMCNFAQQYSCENSTSFHLYHLLFSLIYNLTPQQDGELLCFLSMSVFWLELACEILYELATVGGANITTDGAS